MQLVACLRTDFDMEIQHSQLEINYPSDTPSTKAAGGGIFSGMFTQGRQDTTQGQEDFELSWYLFFQHSPGPGVNNSATARAKGKKKSRGWKVSFNGKKAAKPTKLHK